jgi:hypothetical protein
MHRRLLPLVRWVLNDPVLRPIAISKKGGS